MTTAHKPTWNPAVGSDHQGGTLRGVHTRMTSAKSLPSHLSLNMRKPGQNTPSEQETDRDILRMQLEEKEKIHFVEKRKEREFDDFKSIEDGTVKRIKLDDTSQAQDDNFDEFANELDRDDSSESDFWSDDEEEDELKKELEKIRQENEEKRERERKQREIDELQSKADSVLSENSPATFSVTKKWYDDVVFRNQASGPVAKKQKVRFINDTLRNDFHKKFLNKYIK
eukprot:TRINITY_DN9986_c0_g1_i1.p1 TRINITY_DN9986_c0_g1~~TRINITY_DN9986_c0_g1_i1.p1  ORF type:complete len:227 (-),score=72.07 TRINITY_DN9986_c0_g1_i1:33-713(-)